MATMIQTPKRVYSVAEAAQILGVSESKVYQLVRMQGFPTVMVGRRIKVSVQGLDRWIEEQAEKGWYIA